MISDIEYDKRVRETLARLEEKSGNSSKDLETDGCRLRLEIRITKIIKGEPAISLPPPDYAYEPDYKVDENAEETSGIGLIRRDTGEFYPIGACTRIGRAADNDIIIAEPKGHYVSAYHAEIDFDDFDFYIRDREGGSTNGTFVNGRKIDEATISIGDRIRFADIDFTVIAR